MSSKWFRYGFLIFFLTMFGNMVFQTYLVGAGDFLCNNITEEFTFFRYNRDNKFERGTKHWQKEWQVSIKKDVLPAEYAKILVRWQRLKSIVGAMR